MFFRLCFCVLFFWGSLGFDGFPEIPVFVLFFLRFACVVLNRLLLGYMDINMQ